MTKECSITNSQDHDLRLRAALRRSLELYHYNAMRGARTSAVVLLTFCVWLAGVQWWQICYRLHLFYRDYGQERYVNHVDGAVFVMIHVVNVVLLFAAVFAALTFWRAPGIWRWCAIGIAVINAVAWLTFVCMHATGVLVGYSDFIQHRMGK